MKIMSSAEAAKYLDVTVRTLQSYRARRIGPPYLQMEGKVKYLEEDLIAYVKSKKVITSREGA